MVLESKDGSEGSLSDGVQQALEVSLITDASEIQNSSFAISVFPNPVTNTLVLETEIKDVSALSYNLFDIKGNQLLQDGIKAKKTAISVSSLPAATYILKIMDSENLVQYYSIIKH